MNSEPVRVVFRTVAVLIGAVTYLALAFGWGVDQVDVIQAATTSVAVAGIIAGAAEYVRNYTEPWPGEDDA